MKKAISLGILLSICAGVSWGEVGIGASFRSNDAAIYIPWQMNDHFRIEGQVRLLENDLSDSSSLSDNFGTAAPEREQESAETTEYGLGFFWTRPMSADMLLLLGIRLDYSKQESTLLAREGTTVLARGKASMDGNSYAPTLGLEYLFSPKLRLAAEVNYFSRELDGDATVTQTSSFFGTLTSRIDIESEQKGTNTRLVLRYFF